MSRASERAEQVEQLMRVVDRALIAHGFARNVRDRYPQAFHLEIDGEKYAIHVTRRGR